MWKASSALANCCGSIAHTSPPQAVQRLIKSIIYWDFIIWSLERKMVKVDVRIRSPWIGTSSNYWRYARFTMSNTLYVWCTWVIPKKGEDTQGVRQRDTSHWYAIDPKAIAKLLRLMKISWEIEVILFSYCSDSIITWPNQGVRDKEERRSDLQAITSWQDNFIKPRWPESKCYPLICPLYERGLGGL